LGRKKANRQRGYTSGWFDYKTGEVCLAFWEKNNRVIERIPFKWYFYMSVDDTESIRSRVFDSYIDDLKLTKDEKFYRIYSSSWWDDRMILFNWLRGKGVTPLEGDLPPIGRYLTDNPVKYDENPRRLYYDLETDTRKHGWENIAGHRILSVAFSTGEDEEPEWIVARSADDKGERELLETYLNEVVAEHDTLIAWNGDAYDEIVLRARCKRLGLRPAWEMINFFDMMVMFKHPYFGYGRDAEGGGVKTSYKLGDIGEKLVGEKKTEGVQVHKMYEVWKNQREVMEEYNKQDVRIMCKVEKKYGYIDSMVTLSHMCNRFLSSWSLRLGYLNDAYVLRYGVENSIHFKTKSGSFGKVDFKKEKMKGAYVVEPKMGLYENVSVVDFASMYPNIIKMFNISPETKVGTVGDAFATGVSCSAYNGAIFRTDVIGVFPAMVTKALDARKQHRDLTNKLEETGQEGTLIHRRAKQRSNANKVVANGMYGLFGDVRSRFYDPECGEAVTLTGQGLLNLLIDEADDCGIGAIGGDTDSGFIKCGKERSIEFCDFLGGRIDEESAKRGGKTGLMKLEFKKEYQRLFFTAKKWYAGCKVGGEKGKPDIKGMEYIRTDDCKYARDFQKDMIDYILYAKKPINTGAEKLLRDWRDRLFEGTFDSNDIVIAQSVQKKLKDYKVDIIHARIAKGMLKAGKEVYQGMKIPYIITGKEDGKQVGVHIDDFTGHFDKLLYWKDKIYPPTLRILNSVFPEKSWDVMLKFNPKHPLLFDDVPKKYKRRRMVDA